MMKARTALTLSKTYRQDQALEWGFLTVPEVSHRDARRRARRARNPAGPMPDGAEMPRIGRGAA